MNIGDVPFHRPEVVEKTSGNATTQRVVYTYDVFDRRIGRAVDASGPFDLADAAIERYVYDGDNVVLDFLDPDGDGTGTAQALKTRYLHGPAVDQILAQEDAGTNAVLWQLGDHLGTVRDVVESDGDLVAHVVYDSFGRVLNVKNAAGQSIASPTRYLFTGREYDPATGLQYNHARWYDSETGNWISEDPSGFAARDMSLVRYVSNSPLLLLDPSGHDNVAVIITDKTASGDSDVWHGIPINDLGGNDDGNIGAIFDHVHNNDQLIDHLQGLVQDFGQIDHLHISGHELIGGGIVYRQGTFSTSGLTDSQIETIKDLLSDSAIIYLDSCSQGQPYNLPGVHQLADALGRPIQVTPYKCPCGPIDRGDLFSNCALWWEEMPPVVMIIRPGTGKPPVGAPRPVGTVK